MAPPLIGDFRGEGGEHRKSPLDFWLGEGGKSPLDFMVRGANVP